MLQLKMGDVVFPVYVDALSYDTGIRLKLQIPASTKPPRSDINCVISGLLCGGSSTCVAVQVVDRRQKVVFKDFAVKVSSR